jgi:solute:Na+ symporter, SSS family
LHLSLTGLDWGIGTAALAFNLLLGIWFAFRAKRGVGSDEFFLAGRRLTWPVIGASLLATNIGAEHMVGLCGDAYRYGFCAGANELTTAICLGTAAAILFPYYLKNRVFTIPEFLELRYRKEARFVFSGMMLLMCVVNKMAFCLYAGALVMQSLLGWDIMVTIALLALITAIITIIGGFGVVAYTDAIHAPIMIAGSAAVLGIGLWKVGGWSGLESLVAKCPLPDALHLHKPYTDPNYPFWGNVATQAFLCGIFYWGVDQVNVQRVLGARDLNQARWGAMFALLLKLTPAFIFALPGVIVLALYPGLKETRSAFVVVLNDLLPTGFRGYVLSALVGTIISAIIAVMNSVATMSVRDFIVPFRPQTSERAQVRLGRLAILLSGVLGVLAAYVVHKQSEGIYKYLQTIGVYMIIPLAPAIIFGIISKFVTFAGAAASVGMGLAISGTYMVDTALTMLVSKEAAVKVFPFLHYTLTENYTYRGVWGTTIITLTLFLVSAFTKKSDPEKLTKTTIDWNGKPEPFRGLSDWRLHLAALSVATVLIYWWLW